MPASLVSVSNALFEALNGVAGRSWLFDSLVALPVDNILVKAGPIGACFAYAWFAETTSDDRVRRRRILIASLVAVVLVLGVNRSIAKQMLLPRPLVMAEHVELLNGNRLVDQPRLAYRVPLAGQTRERVEKLERGTIADNDLISFPSDHAAFFLVLALGILLASRRAGWIALGWSVLVIMLSRIITGMHSPLDIAAGAAIGGAGFLLVHFVAAGRMRRWADAVSGWTVRHEGLSAACIGLVIVEIVGTLDATEDLLRSAKSIAERMMGA